MAFMGYPVQIFRTSLRQAAAELSANKTRSFLSLLGITIGIFCIISVFTVIDSLEKNLKENMASLGSDVLYLSRKPWVPEGEFRWWEYLEREPMGERELESIERLSLVQFATICHSASVRLTYRDDELEGPQAYGVSEHFDRVQNLDIEKGRYLSASEIASGASVAVIGKEIEEQLFPLGVEAVGKSIRMKGKTLQIVGVMKKTGQNMAGFQFDNAVVYPFRLAQSLFSLRSRDWNNDPVIMVKSRSGARLEDMNDQIQGALRALRKVKPGEANNFSVNQLSQVSERMNLLFGTINLVGAIIGGFALLVGGFGIANIMFVTVRERTRLIGIKKAIGARRKNILSEFLIEAVVLCLIGGAAGILVVMGLGLIMTHAMDFPVSLSLKNSILGLTISALVGILAGYIPARTAARLDPVVAIRSQA